MTRAINAGFIYFAAVFAAGIVLGVLRILFLVPRTGELAAVLLELPIILALSWMICRRILLWQPLEPGEAAIIGATALALLLTAEGSLSLATGRSLNQHLALYEELPNQIGLAGQFVFALFPRLQARRARR
jgi:hypothetical protein